MTLGYKSVFIPFFLAIGLVIFFLLPLKLPSAVAQSASEETSSIKLQVWADPPGGTYEPPLTVALITNDPEAKIFYAFSGLATPDETYEYQAPVTLEESSELWFFAFTDIDRATPILTEKYVLEGKSGSGTILINELYPVPEESGENPWIELINVGNANADLTGYYFTNQGEKKFSVPPTMIEGKGIHLIAQTDPALLLGTQDVLQLHDVTGQIIDRVEYRDAPAKKSLIRLYDSEDSYFFRPTEIITPGAPNILQNSPVIKVTRKRSIQTRPELSLPTTFYPVAFHPTVTAPTTPSDEAINPTLPPVRETTLPVLPESPNNKPPLSDALKTSVTDNTSQENTLLVYLIPGSVVLILLLLSAKLFLKKNKLGP